MHMFTYSISYMIQQKTINNIILKSIKKILFLRVGGKEGSS